MPALLRKENANQVPVNALWLTNAMVQLGAILFAKARLEVNRPVFTNVEKPMLAAVVVAPQ